MRVPRLDPRSMLVVGLLLIVGGVLVRCTTPMLMWSGDAFYAFDVSVDLGGLVLTALDQVLLPLGVAFVAGAFVLAALVPRGQDGLPPR
jgi:hypothetical protein